MRSVLSNLVFYSRFGLGLLIAGYFLLIGGVIDVMERFKNEPDNWLGIILGIVRAVLFAVAALVLFVVLATVSLLIGDGKSSPRRALVGWLDKIDARHLHQNRTKIRS